MSIFKPVTLITGASSGIGAALARVFAANGHDVALVARREAELSALAESIAAAGVSRPCVVTADLVRSDAPARIAHELLQRGLEPSIVINNAGFGLHGLADELDRAEQLSMIDLNIRALTDLSLRWMESVHRHRGGIINVASIAGLLPGPHMAVYFATKAYVISFTEALRAELKSRGVKVTLLCPGPVRTGFQERAGIGGEKLPRLLSRSAEEVAREAYDGFMVGRSIVVPGWPNRLMTMMPRLFPRRGLSALVLASQRNAGRHAGPEWRRRLKGR
jgi:uncharacterized protein